MCQNLCTQILSIDALLICDGFAIIPGWLFDLYASYTLSFILGGASVLVSGLVTVLLAVSMSRGCCH